ncbi:MAG TPA: porin family protein [Edaphocola sp.]|nr:porin family protein [Edaphocola sp.]
MKKVLIAVSAATMLSLGANAQSIEPEVGVNFGSVQTKTGNTTSKGDGMMTLSAGLGLKYDLTDNVYLRPGIFYSGTGIKSQLLGITSTARYDYIQVPVTLGFNYDMNKAGALFAEVGPYVGYALSGKTTIESSLGSTKNDIKFGSKLTETNALDYGAKFGVGYVTPFNIFVRAQYNLGLGNLSNASNTTTNNKYWNVSVGYRVAF